MPKDDISPPLQGLAVAAMFWFWGALFFFGPWYVGDQGRWQILTNVLGAGLITVGFVAAATEFAKLRRNQAFEYWAVSILFLMPAAIIHLAIDFGSPSHGWQRVTRIVVLLLLAFGIPFILMGLAHFFVLTKEPAQSKARSDAQRADDVKLWAALLIALLSVAATVLKIVIEFGG
jgi:uncharacterized membrane protein